MAVVGDQLLTRVFGHSKAEKCFRTWWDTIEDYMVYGLVTMGIIVMPTAMVINKPLHCNFLGDKSPLGFNLSDQDDIDYNKDPKFNLWWVRKACLFNGSVSPFMLYLPYILLIMALILFATERIFSRAFKAGLKLEKLYKLLVHRNVIEDIDKDETDGKEVTEAKESFRGSKSYFISFVIK